MNDKNTENMNQMSEKTSAPAGMQDVRTYLRNVRHLHLRTMVLCERAEHYREMAMRATSRTDALRTSGAPGRSKVETYVLELMEVHDKLKSEIDVLLRQSRRAEKLIGKLPDERHRAILQLRYLCAMDWEEISQKLNFSIRWVHSLHREAMMELETIYHQRRH